MVAPHQTPEIESSKTASASKRPGIREYKKRPMFDTLQVSNDLKRGGLAEPQAEAIVSAFSTIFRDVLTKDDLKAALKDYPTREELKVSLESCPTKAELKAGLATLQARLTFLMILMSGVIVGAIGLLIKL